MGWTLGCKGAGRRVPRTPAGRVNRGNLHRRRGKRKAAHCHFHRAAYRNVIWPDGWDGGGTPTRGARPLCGRGAYAPCLAYIPGKRCSILLGTHVSPSGGHIAVMVAPTDEVIPPERQGWRPFPQLMVVYSADRGMIVTGYQFSDLAQTGIPAEAQWLR